MTEQSLRPTAAQVRRRGSYGIDAPYVPALLLFFGLLLVVLAVISLVSAPALGGWLTLIGGLFLTLCGLSYVYATRRGKFEIWAGLLDDLRLRGDEHLLDMGCGRGAVLLQAADLLPAGRAVGVDLWKSSDQSGNAADATLRNADLEGVAQRIELHTGDMTAMPLPDAGFDVVVSSLAIHNIKQPAGRRQAIDEAVRVLRPGGRVVIADIRATDEYAARLTELGMTGVTRRPLGWRFWFGGPWVATKLVTATRPGGPSAPPVG